MTLKVHEMAYFKRHVPEYLVHGMLKIAKKGDKKEFLE